MLYEECGLVGSQGMQQHTEDRGQQPLRVIGVWANWKSKANEEETDLFESYMYYLLTLYYEFQGV